MQHKMMTQTEYKTKVLDIIELDTVPTVDQLLDNVTLPTSKLTSPFLTKARALLAKQQLVDATLSNIAPLPKGKKWIPCPECGLPQCSLGYWE